MNLAKKTHNLITFPLEKKTLRILFFTIDNTTTTTTNKPNTAMYETNTHWHCSADKKQQQQQTQYNLRFGPLGNRPSQANITLSLEKRRQTIGKTSCRAAGFHSYFTAYFDGGGASTHTRAVRNSYTTQPHPHTHTHSKL